MKGEANFQWLLLLSPSYELQMRKSSLEKFPHDGDKIPTIKISIVGSMQRLIGGMT